MAVIFKEYKRRFTMNRLLYILELICGDSDKSSG